MVSRPAVSNAEPTYLSTLHHTYADAYDPLEAARAIYPEAVAGRASARLAEQFSTRLGIRRRSCVLDLGALPDKVYSSPEHHPVAWGTRLFEESVPDSVRGEIGAVIASYNVTGHRDVLPGIAAQLVNELGIPFDAIPLDLPYLGCAGGVIALERARQTAAATGKAVFVYVFDQCFWTLHQTFDRSDPRFRKSLIANCLFSDGAVSFLVLPERLKHLASGPKMRLGAQRTLFIPGREIRMDGEVFLLGDALAKVMPGLVMNELVGPLLREAELDRGEVDEWSLHQGGTAVMEAFTALDELPLSAAQIAPSLDAFREFGNLSGPSCFLVLRKHFERRADGDDTPRRGMVVGFGAGYYLSACLYDWE
ncbi:MAG: hypothetical protein AAF682_11505 [Planctomycetota bacterium]